jgi:predicted TIM-barrel fold metal-dependent hydrolase
MRIIDAHVHVLDNYPPMDPFQDLGRHDRLLKLMDDCGVEKAVMIPIVADFSPTNNEDCARLVKEHPDRFAVLADVNLVEEGAAAKVAEVRDKFGAVGVSCYPSDNELKFLVNDGSDALMDALEKDDLVCNLHCSPFGYASAIEAARRRPNVRFLLNHFGLPKRGDSPEEDAKYGKFQDAASTPNLYVKASGFYHVAGTTWDFKCPEALGYLSRLIETIGTERVLWGSDWPPSGNHVTYMQDVEIVRSVAGLDDESRRLILGENAAKVLKI